VALAACTVVTAACAAGAPAASAAPDCDRYASTSGSDGGTGTQEQPYRTVQALVTNLASGETGCLAAGERFNEGFLQINRSDIALTSAPGERATIVGDTRIETVPGRVRNVELSGLNFTGGSGTRPLFRIVADDIRLIGNDISNPGRTTCLNIAPLEARNIRIEGNFIHDCGPAVSNTESGVGVDTGRNVTITDNYIFRNPARGVQLYPDANGTVIRNNVIDGNTDNVQFAGDSSRASRGNRVLNSLLSNASSYNVTHNWDGPVGSDNVVSDSCLDGANGNSHPTPTGWSFGSGNIFGAPQYTNRGAPPGGYALVPGSVCVGKGPLPAATTADSPDVTVDATAASVISAVARGTVNPHWQPTTYRVEFGTAAGAYDRRTDELDAGAGTVAETRTATLTGLAPSTRYFYRLVATHASGGTEAGGEHSFETPPPPLLRPVTDVDFHSRPLKRMALVESITVTDAPDGSTATARCRGGGGGRLRCPANEQATASARATFRRYRNRRLRAGATVEVRVTKPGTIGRLFVLKVVHVRDGFYLLREQRQGCIGPDEQSEIPCLHHVFRAQRLPRGSRITNLRVRNMSAGSVVVVRCQAPRGRRCPRAPDRRVITTPTEELRFKRFERQWRAGSRIELFVIKPHTIGTFTRITIRGRRRPALERTICIESEDRDPIRCPTG
jgi:hypothetical protein